MSRPRVVIVGGGFGGLAAARALRSAPVDVVLLDRSNHHLFQPLLYQVATSVLTPGQIASPIRNILRKQKNASVILAEVTAVDKQARHVIAKNVDREGVAIAYDYLILATGAHHSYFGHEEMAPFAAGLKSAADAVLIRNRILQAFERAEAMEDPSRQDGLLTFVLVGAGPTGVEMAGAISVLIRQTLRTEFRRCDPASARIVLVEGGSRILPSFSEPLSRAATNRLEGLGVEFLPGHVDRIDEDGAWMGEQRIPSKTVIWTAGVKASPVGEWLGAETDRSGRVTAAIAGAPAPSPFRYFDKGSMAVVGKGFAVLEVGKLRLSGLPAWMVWAVVHIHFLAQESLRLSVFLQWIWTF
jgi:NADH dehydrogenase FAD-containing subunit